jgi:hypothetical protein
MAEQPTSYVNIESSQALALNVRSEATTGDLTFFYLGLGACGWNSGDNDNVVAVSHLIYDPQTPDGNSNHNPLCGRWIHAWRTREDGQEVHIDVKVVDKCESDSSMTRVLLY